MTTTTRKKIQHIWRVHNASQDLKCIEINGRNIDYDAFICARRAAFFVKMRKVDKYKADEYIVHETVAVPYDMIKEILVNGRRCIYD